MKLGEFLDKVHIRLCTCGYVVARIQGCDGINDPQDLGYQCINCGKAYSDEEYSKLRDVYYAPNTGAIW